MLSYIMTHLHKYNPSYHAQESFSARVVHVLSSLYIELYNYVSLYTTPVSKKTMAPAFLEYQEKVFNILSSQL